MGRACYPGGLVRYSPRTMRPNPTAQRPVNAFTVDVEDYFHVAALSSVISRDSWATREYRVEANTERLLALLAEHQVHGTFFVLGWVAERSPGLVRRIAQAGHEIACHGFSHQLVYRQSPQRSPRTAGRDSGTQSPERTLRTHAGGVSHVGGEVPGRAGTGLRLGYFRICRTINS